MTATCTCTCAPIVHESCMRMPEVRQYLDPVVFAVRCLGASVASRVFSVESLLLAWSMGTHRACGLHVHPSYMRAACACRKRSCSLLSPSSSVSCAVGGLYQMQVTSFSRVGGWVAKNEAGRADKRLVTLGPRFRRPGIKNPSLGGSHQSPYLYRLDPWRPLRFL